MQGKKAGLMGTTSALYLSLFACVGACDGVPSPEASSPVRQRLACKYRLICMCSCMC